MCENGQSFSSALASTHKVGLFEDDVFVDLEGTEAAQKLLMLCRELGFSMEIEDIEIEPLASRREVPAWDEDTLAHVFSEEDVAMAERARRAAAKNCTLRYIQRIECSPPAELGSPPGRGRASVRLEEVPLQSGHAMVKGAVYYFAFHTERYRQHPLIVQVRERTRKSTRGIAHRHVLEAR